MKKTKTIVLYLILLAGTSLNADVTQPHGDASPLQTPPPTTQTSPDQPSSGPCQTCYSENGKLNKLQKAFQENQSSLDPEARETIGQFLDLARSVRDNERSENPQLTDWIHENLERLVSSAPVPADGEREPSRNPQLADWAKQLRGPVLVPRPGNSQPPTESAPLAEGPSQALEPKGKPASPPAPDSPISSPIPSDDGIKPIRSPQIQHAEKDPPPILRLREERPELSQSVEPLPEFSIKVLAIPSVYRTEIDLERLLGPQKASFNEPRQTAEEKREGGASIPAASDGVKDSTQTLLDPPRGGSKAFLEKPALDSLAPKKESPAGLATQSDPMPTAALALTTPANSAVSPELSTTPSDESKAQEEKKSSQGLKQKKLETSLSPGKSNPMATNDLAKNESQQTVSKVVTASSGSLKKKVSQEKKRDLFPGLSKAFGQLKEIISKKKTASLVVKAEPVKKLKEKSDPWAVDRTPTSLKNRTTGGELKEKQAGLGDFKFTKYGAMIFTGLAFLLCAIFARYSLLKGKTRP